MYETIVAVLLLLVFMYLFIIEYTGYIPDHDIRYPINDYNSNENNDTYKNYIESFKSKVHELLSTPKFPPITYENDYKPILNQETLYDFVPYNDYIKKDILPNKKFTVSKIFSLSYELTYQEMDEYLSSLKTKLNSKISNTKVLKHLNEIKREKWSQKEVLSKMVYNTYMLDKTKKKSDKYRNIDNLISTAEVFSHNFVNMINNNFVNTKYYQKYNKKQIYIPYKIINIKLLKYFEYKTDEHKLSRYVVVIYLHRKDKINDFNILLDYFIQSKTDSINYITDLEDVEKYNNNNQIFLKTSKVYGMPISYNYKYLDYDDTDYSLKIKPLIDNRLKNTIIDIKKKSNKKDTRINLYLKFIKKAENTDLNKNFNQDILFDLVLIKNNIEKGKDIKSIHFEYNNIIKDILKRGFEILNNIKYEQKEFNKEQDYDLDNISKNLLFSEKSFNKEDKEKKTKLSDETKYNDSIYSSKFLEIQENELKKKKNQEIYNKYQCFHPLKEDNVLERLDNRMFCESYHKEINNTGIWDRKCIDDTECPYYISNKNYPNEFGGCQDDGICQMPIGIKRVGKKKISKDSVPLCYNCNTTPISFDCCYNQNLNPKLKSPDYMFENDTEKRNEHKHHLKKHGLKP